jgi:hypothetical protein
MKGDPMKQKSIMFVSMMLCLILLTGTATAQIALPKVWSDTASAYPYWFMKADKVRGMGYNPTNNHLYIATRDSIPGYGTNFGGILILNAATGDTLGHLDMTGISGGTYNFNKVAVSADGRIYTTNLTVAVTKAAPLKIYTWANETAAPKIAFADSVLGPRLGDALTVVGSGTATYVYVAGNATPGPVTVFKRDATNADSLNVYKTITPTGWATGVLSIAPITNGFSSFWLKTSGKSAIKFDTAGAAQDTVTGTVVATGYTASKYFEFSGRKYLLVFMGNVNPSLARVVDITDGGTKAIYIGVTPALGTVANANATGEVEYNPADTSFFVLSTNNSVGKYSLKNTAPVLTYFNRTPYVPTPGQPDTVFIRALSFKDVTSMKLYYYGYRTSVSDANGIDSAIVTMTSFSGNKGVGVYSAIIPGSVHRDGRRIEYRVNGTDTLKASTTTLFPGYFAGLTKLALTNGPREVDTLGALKYKGYGLRVNGVCIMEDSVTYNYQLDAYVQDSLGGADIFKGTPLVDNLIRGNNYTIEGALDQYRGKLELIMAAGATKFAITDNGPGVLPKPKLVTVRDLMWDRRGEELENTLIMVTHLRLTVASLPWPAAGASGTNITVTDNGVDSMTLRVPAWSNLNGMTLNQPFTAVGVANQFGTSTAPFNTGYQIIPRDAADISADLIEREMVMWGNAKIKTGVTNVGHIGSLNDYPGTGEGFIYNGANRSYEGSLIFASDPQHVSSTIRTGSGAWLPGLNQRSKVTTEKVGTILRANTSYDDANMARPIGIKIDQRMFADTVVGHDNAMGVILKATNMKGSAISGLYLGGYFDFDMTTGYVDRGAVLKDTTNTIPGVNGGQPFKTHITYMNATGNANFVGVVPLSQCVFKAVRVVINPSEVYGSAWFGDTVKYKMISELRPTKTYTDSGIAQDHGIALGFGPYTLNTTDTATVAFAFVAGQSLQELITNARTAQKDWVLAGNTMTYLTGVGAQNANLPLTYSLEQNYPNPFNPTTSIKFTLPKASDVTLKVYDLLGREVRTLVNGTTEAGYYETVWNGHNNLGAQVATGVYIYRIEAGSFVSTKKMMLLK